MNPGYVKGDKDANKDYIAAEERSYVLDFEGNLTLT